LERYSRQIILPQIGPEGQERLAAASVLVIGAGGLGSTLLYCLAGAGVGRIGIIDDDTVSESNLNRQFLFAAADIGREKAAAAAERLRAFNPRIKIEELNQRVTEKNAPELIAGRDLVILAVDNIETRLHVNRACCGVGTALINGGVEGFYGYVQIVEPGLTACVECLYAQLRGSRAEELPSLGAAVSVISSLMADAAVLTLLGLPNPLNNGMLFIDAENLTFERAEISRKRSCPACGQVSGVR